MTGTLRGFALWLVLVLLLLAVFTLFQKPGQRPAGQTISFSQLVSDADRGQIRTVVIQGQRVRASYIDGRQLDATAPNDPGLVQRLHDKGIQVTVVPTDDMPWYVSVLGSWAPIVALLAVWVFLSRRMRSGGVIFGGGEQMSGTVGRVFGRGNRVIPGQGIDDPQHWRDKAAEARATSGLLTDHDSRRQMVEIARGYEYLAQRAEERQRGS